MTSPRMIHMYMDSLVHARHKILDSDKKTVLYRTHRHLRIFKSNNTPEVEVFRADPTAPDDPSKDVCVGTASRRHSKTGNTIDLEINGHKIEFRLGSPKQPGCMQKRVYQSPRPKGGKISWEAFGTMRETVEMSEQHGSGDEKILLAKLDRLMWSWRKFARLELYSDISQEMMDEIAISGAAMWLSLESADGEDASSAYGAAAAAGLAAGGGGGGG